MNFQHRTAWKVLILYDVINKLGTIDAFSDESQIHELVYSTEMLYDRQEMIINMITNRGKDFPLTKEERRKFMDTIKLPRKEAAAFNNISRVVKEEIDNDLYRETEEHVVEELRNRYKHLLTLDDVLNIKL